MTIGILDAAKRPVSAVADFTEVRDFFEARVAQDFERCIGGVRHFLRLMF